MFSLLPIEIIGSLAAASGTAWFWRRSSKPTSTLERDLLDRARPLLLFSGDFRLHLSQISTRLQQLPESVRAQTTNAVLLQIDRLSEMATAAYTASTPASRVELHPHLNHQLGTLEQSIQIVETEARLGAAPPSPSLDPEMPAQSRFLADRIRSMALAALQSYAYTPGDERLVTIRRALIDYLPHTLAAYASTDGESAAQEKLQSQLQILADQVNTSLLSLAQQAQGVLDTNGRFFARRFSSTEQP